MPSGALPEIVKEPAATTLVEDPDVISVKAESYDCPFCHHPNDAQTMTCDACRSVLTLSDLEMLLANQNSEKAVVRRAVEEMERQRMSRELTVNELVTLGVGHINLRNLQMGYTCLLDASKQNPNDVVLGGQVNALLIRLDEIKKQEEAHLKMPKGKSILVVDDSPTVRKLIAGKLEKCGHEVICANDGVEAMERLENFVPDLILLDITMPRMDGYQVCKQIRSNNATKDVTVVMISGKDGFFDKVRGRMAGTTGYITKPFGPETLMKAVEMYLSGEVPNLDDQV
jgi:twitching motility two-component system response regulator PilG